MLKLAQAESDFGLKSQHDDTSQKTNLKTNPKVKLKLSNVTLKFCTTIVTFLIYICNELTTPGNVN